MAADDLRDLVVNGNAWAVPASGGGRLTFPSPCDALFGGQRERAFFGPTATPGTTPPHPS